MRIVKEAEERKNEILDVADELFFQKGFDNTSTNDIIQKVGIARGTLYYHFKSKEDVLDALINRYTIHILGKAQEIATDKSIPVLERIIRVVVALNIREGNGKEIFEQIHKPQNALMHHKMQKAIINGITPILTAIIREGIELGMFFTQFPYECMEMVAVYMNTVFDGEMVEMTDEERLLRIQAFISNTERMLGAKDGSLKEVMKIFISGAGGSNE